MNNSVTHVTQGGAETGSGFDLHRYIYLGGLLSQVPTIGMSLTGIVPMLLQLRNSGNHLLRGGNCLWHVRTP